MLGACSRIASSTNARNEEKAKALSNRAWAHNVKDMSDAAIADANEAIRLNPAFVGAYDNRAWAYIEKGEFVRDRLRHLEERESQIIAEMKARDTGG